MTNAYWPTQTPDQFGPIVGGDDVRSALVATINLYAPSYIAEVSARMMASGAIATPLDEFGTWRNEPDYRTLTTNRAPAYMVQVQGTQGVPETFGNGLVAAKWLVDVETVVWGTDWQDTQTLVLAYDKILRSIILQHRSLGGVVNGTAWLGTVYKELDRVNTRTLGGSTSRYAVTVLDSVNVNGGPLAAPLYPVPLDDTVGSVNVTVTGVPISQAVPEGAV